MHQPLPHANIPTLHLFYPSTFCLSTCFPWTGTFPCFSAPHSHSPLLADQPTFLSSFLLFLCDAHLCNHTLVCATCFLSFRNSSPGKWVLVWLVYFSPDLSLCCHHSKRIFMNQQGHKNKKRAKNKTFVFLEVKQEWGHDSGCCQPFLFVVWRCGFHFISNELTLSDQNWQLHFPSQALRRELFHS